MIKNTKLISNYLSEDEFDQTTIYSQDKANYLQSVRKYNKCKLIEFDNIKLDKKVRKLEKETIKLKEAKLLFNDYHKIVDNYKLELENLRNQYNFLEALFYKIPSWIRNIFIKKDKIKFLNSNND